MLISVDFAALNLKRGIEKMQKGDVVEGIGAFAAVGNAGIKDGYFLLGWFFAYGYGVDTNLSIADKYLKLSGYNDKYDIHFIVGLSESEFISYTNNMKEQLNQIVNVQINIMNSINSMNVNTMQNNAGVSSDTKCSRCGGMGVCKSCGNSGGSMEYVDGYTGSGTKSWINCGECNGLKHCRVCHGRGYIY